VIMMYIVLIIIVLIVIPKRVNYKLITTILIMVKLLGGRVRMSSTTLTGLSRFFFSLFIIYYSVMLIRKTYPTKEEYE